MSVLNAETKKDLRLKIFFINYMNLDYKQV